RVRRHRKKRGHEDRTEDRGQAHQTHQRSLKLTLLTRRDLAADHGLERRHRRPEHRRENENHVEYDSGRGEPERSETDRLTEHPDIENPFFPERPDEVTGQDPLRDRAQEPHESERDPDLSRAPSETMLREESPDRRMGLPRKMSQDENDDQPTDLR